MHPGIEPPDPSIRSPIQTHLPLQPTLPVEDPRLR